MKKVYAYTRVSTLKQGEKGVSLQEQKAAILRYAEKNGLTIVKWFEERVTAAKSGRPFFMTMLKGLRQRTAEGVVMHKIDRSTRNLRDWADLGDLIDAGVSVYFANEGLDLQSRGGRLSADIQAVVASDYIRNLREEALKGINGRLAQGVLPFQAPIGYLNNGGGKVKTIDPVRGPLIRMAFERYATGSVTLDSLVEELFRAGLRNRFGGRVTKTCLSMTLNNPFYNGLIFVRRRKETYVGRHEALVSKELFEAVQDRLAGRFRSKGWRHEFPLRGVFSCALCGRVLTGENQKGHNYYRCHKTGCPTTCFREEVLEDAMFACWPAIARSDSERAELFRHLEKHSRESAGTEGQERASLDMQLGAVKTRLDRLIDAFVDGNLEKTDFESRKQSLLTEQRRLEDLRRSVAGSSAGWKAKISELFELAAGAQRSYRLGNAEEKRELAISLCSNRTVSGKDVLVEPSFPLSVLARRESVLSSAHSRNAIRTEKEWRKVVKILWDWAKQEVGREHDTDPLCA